MEPPEEETLRMKAEKDLVTAKIIYESNGELTSIVCFHIQQYVEKTIKAKLLQHNIKYRKSHDILYLLRLFENEKLSDDYIDDANRLTGYCVNSRYDSLEPSKDEMDKAFIIADRIVKAVNSIK